MKALSISLAILFVGQTALAQPYGYGGSSNNTSSSNGGSGPAPYGNPVPYRTNTGLGNFLPPSIYNQLPSFNNPFQSGNSTPSTGGYNPFFNNSGLFSQTYTSYYIYPPFPGPSGTPGPPETLVPNNDGTWNIYPPTSGTLSDVANRARLVVPNNDGSWYIYPPGVQPGNNQSGTNQSVTMQPDKVVPAGNGSYNVFPPFSGPPGEITPNMQPGRIIPNGDGTYSIYSPFGGPPERVVPINSGQSPMLAPPTTR